MNEFAFWKNWHPTSRAVYLSLLGLFGLCIACFFLIYPQGFLNVVSWERISELVDLPVVQEPITVGLFSFSYALDFNLVQEHFLGSSLKLSPIGAYVLLTLVAITWAFLLTIISAVDGFWYYVGTLLLLGIILLFQFEQLLWFGQAQKIGVIIAFTLFLGPTFYFQHINPDFGLVPRLLTFTGSTAVFGLLIWLFTEAKQPFLTLAYHGLGVSIAFSIVFILILGHELISFFTTIITQSNTPRSSNSLLHLGILSLVYLVNLGLLFLKNIGSLHWDIVYLDAFWLLLVLGVVGIWGFRQREIQYKFIFPFAPLGAMLYLCLAMCTFGTIVFLSWQGNDPLLESLEDCIVYSQLGFSFVFLLYLIANFIQPLISNQRVNLVMYRPNTLPYATALIGGAIATLGFFARGSFFAYYQIIAGYYNGIGDLHWIKDDLFVAEQYYKLSDQYANDNHRANYALGALARQQQDAVLSAFYFQEAQTKKPTPLSYANTSAAYETTNQYFDALFTLKRGIAEFPQNAQLANNLAMIYGQTDILDSAIYWLSRSAENSDTQKAAEANILALLAESKDQLSTDIDSLANDFLSDRTYPPSIINHLALHARKEPIDSLEAWLSPKNVQPEALSSFTFAQLHNYLLASTNVDTTLLGQTENLAEMAENFPYTEYLVFATAQARYRQNQIVEAYRKLDRLQSVNIFKQNYYLDIMGLWALEQQAPRQATRFFAQLAERKYRDSALKFAVSLTESLASPDVELDQVLASWQDIVMDSTQTVHHLTAQKMLELLQSPYSELIDDNARYQWLRYRACELKSTELANTFSEFEDNSYAAIAVYDLAMKGESKFSEVLPSLIQGLKENESSLNYHGTIFLEWAWALTEINENNVANWDGRIDRLVALNLHQRYEKQFLQALAAKEKNDPVARSMYLQLLGNPFFEKGFIGAVSHLYSDRNEEAYQLWLDAIQTNPYSSELLAEYILAALRIGSENYAEESLAEYRKMVNEAQFQQFMERYETTKKESEVVF
ncbi:MAG: hypothetical protein AAF992_09130 [Bacteroidota bacterium]